MGLSIGQIPANLGGGAVLPAASGSRPGAQQLGARTGQSEAPTLFPEESAGVARPGFGEGTVSGPIAALQSISRTVEGVRQATPTVQEIRVQLQLEAGRQRDIERRLQQEELIGRFFHRVESRVPEPSPQARNFVESVDGVVPRADNADAPQRPEGPEVFTRTERPDPVADAEAPVVETQPVVDAAHSAPSPEPREVDFETATPAPPPPDNTRNRIDVSV